MVICMCRHYNFVSKYVLNKLMPVKYCCHCNHYMNRCLPQLKNTKMYSKFYLLYQRVPNKFNDYFTSNLSALNTSGLSTNLDPTGQPPGPTSSMLSTPDTHRPGNWASSSSDVQRASTSDVMRAAQHTIEPDPDQEQTVYHEQTVYRNRRCTRNSLCYVLFISANTRY